MNKKLVKELFIIALLVVVVAFILGILFYDYIPVDQKITSVKYVADENVVSTMEAIKSSSGDDISKEDEDSLLQSYSIDKDDLSGYESDNLYDSGKADPFSEDAEPVDDKVVTQSVNATSNKAQNGNVKNTVANNTAVNTVKNTTKDKNTVTNTAKTTNTVKQDSKTNTAKTNTVVNKVTNTVNNTVKNTTKDDSVGTFFEKPNSK